MNICNYGCGQEAKYYFKSVDKWCCSQFACQCSCLKKKNSNALRKVYSSGLRKIIIPRQDKIKGVRKCTLSLRKRLKKQYDKLPFNQKPFAERKRIILKEQEYKCDICRCKNIWNGAPLNFHYDHINGDRSNNSRSNSRLLCPNCHSQTKTYCRGNKEVISENDLKNSLIEHELNINQALKKLNVIPGGTNWTKAKKVIKKYNLARVDELV